MSFRPATAYTRETATAKARELNPFAFCKYAADCPADERYQVLVTADAYDDEGQLVEKDGVYLVASGADWVEALSNFHEWCEEQRTPCEVGPSLPAPAEGDFPERLTQTQRMQALAAATVLRQAMTPEEREAADSLRLREMSTHGEAEN